MCHDCLKEVENAQSEEKLDDLFDQFRLYNYEFLQQKVLTNHKNPNRRDEYRNAKKSKLHELAQVWTTSPFFCLFCFFI
jgi:hypothetical protein